MWLALQHDTPDDFVVATGTGHTSREFVELAFCHLGVTVVWKGDGVDEVGENADSGAAIVRVDPELYRHKPNSQVGDSSKALVALGWKPEVQFKVTFPPHGIRWHSSRGLGMLT